MEYGSSRIDVYAMFRISHVFGRRHRVTPVPAPFNQSLFSLGRRCFSEKISRVVPQLPAPDLSYAQQNEHVRSVAEQLEYQGILKVTLGFADPDGQYLDGLIQSLHRNHGHQLPINHSATRGWFWDVRPLPGSTDTTHTSELARSETMEVFPWHTDCSYEDQPPRYFALQVLRPDRYGGGTLSVVEANRLRDLLPPATRLALMQPEFRINVPAEFIKHPSQRKILGSLLADHGGLGPHTVMRLREDIVDPMTEAASKAMQELRRVFSSGLVNDFAVHLSAEELPEGSIILMDNRRWLHARTSVMDPERHLRRVRWDAAPFP